MKELLAVAREGASSTALLARLRWRMIRVPGVRTTILSAAFFFACAAAVIVNFGFALAVSAQDPTSPANLLARDLIGQLADGRIQGVVSITLLTLLSIAIFGPFTGTGTVSLAQAEDLSGMRPARAHRFFDSLAVNGVSGLGILQLLGLIGLNSFLTMDSHRVPGMLLALALWLVLITLMTTVAWTIEYVVRRFGRWQRYLLAAIPAALGLSAYVSNPDAAATLFGAGDWYVAVLRTDGTQIPLALLTLVAFSTALVLTAVGLRVFLVADRFIPPAPLTSKPGRYRDYSQDGLLAGFRIIVSLVLRTPQTRRPMLAAVIFGIPAVVAVPMDQVLASSLSFAIPLAVALSWPANVYAIVGTGMPWLASQPRVMATLPKAVMIAQFLLTMAVVVTLSSIALLSGRASLEQVSGIVQQASFITLCATGVTALLAILNPIRASLSGRTDALVPPLTALVYMVVLLAFTAVPGVAFGGLLAELSYGAALALGVACVAGLGCGVFALARWRDPQVRSRVVSTVGAE